RILERVRDYCDGKQVRLAQGRNRQADSVHRNRSLFYEISRAAGWVLDFEIPGISFPIESMNPADAVDMTLHDVASEPGIRAHGPLEIDHRAFLQVAEAGGGQRLS